MHSLLGGLFKVLLKDWKRILLHIFIVTYHNDLYLFRPLIFKSFYT